MSRWRIVVVAFVVIGVAAVGFGLWHRQSGNPPLTVSGPGVTPAGDLQPAADTGSSATKPPAATSGTMYFTGLKLETSGPAPQACLTFSQPLSSAASVHFEDFIRIQPAAKPSLQANGNRLCIAGLA